MTDERHAERAIAMLIRRGILTVDPDEATTCCGLARDEDGFCQHRPGHPIYVQLIDGSGGEE